MYQLLKETNWCIMINCIFIIWRYCCSKDMCNEVVEIKHILNKYFCTIFYFKEIFTFHDQWINKRMYI